MAQNYTRDLVKKSTFPVAETATSLRPNSGTTNATHSQGRIVP